MAGTYNAPEWLSPGARDLLGRMLCLDPEHRATLREVAGHAWCRAAAPAWAPPPSVYTVTADAETGGGSGELEASPAGLRGAPGLAGWQLSYGRPCQQSQ
jgi:hypothetical protein